ncbi:MAG: tRNA-guanine(15) transglycosylase [Methanonatronarchaeales archaeon]|nr:tRNA-guanine(15) transglycosylase [Methanonatronarchaeales archaeon]
MKARLARIADYQFGRGAGEALVPEDAEVSARPSMRPEHVSLDGQRLASYRPHVGLLTLSATGAALLHSALAPPALRVYVNDEAAPFVAEGKTAFAKHVVEADREIRAGDEVLVVDLEDNLLGTGKASLSQVEMLSLDRGQAVDVREGVM